MAKSIKNLELCYFMYGLIVQKLKKIIWFPLAVFDIPGGVMVLLTIIKQAERQGYFLALYRGGG